MLNFTEFRQELIVGLDPGSDCDRRPSMPHLYLRIGSSACILSRMDIYKWLLKTRADLNKTSLFVGLSAPQGAGKTTLMNQISVRARADGLSAVSISIDDFYLTRRKQIALSRENPDNQLLQQRGYPLTHDVKLAYETLSRLKADQPEKVQVSIPRYDKSAHEGDGDRAPQSAWETVQAPVDFVLFEGWFLGFRPLPASKVPHPDFLKINEALADYQPLFDLSDAFIWLEPKSLESIVKWRVEVEDKRRARGEKAWTPEKAKAYIKKFIPAYEAYLPGLRVQKPNRPYLHLRLGEERQLEREIF